MSLGGVSGRRLSWLIVNFVGQPDCPIANGKKLRILPGGGNGNASRVRSQSAIVEFGKIANATSNACTDGQRPQHAPLAELNLAAVPCGLEVFYVVLRSSGKEEQLTQVPLSSPLRFPRRPICVLR